MRQLWAPWRMEYVGTDRPERGCVLCAAPEPDSPDASRVVERSELVYTLLNLYPYNSGHLMVVPYRHAPDITALTDEEGAAMVAGAQRALRALTAAMGPDGFNMGINQGKSAGAGINDHVHLHVVPRWDGDTNFMPVLADTKVLPEHMERTADRLRAAFAEPAAQPG